MSGDTPKRVMRSRVIASHRSAASDKLATSYHTCRQKDFNHSTHPIKSLASAPPPEPSPTTAGSSIRFKSKKTFGHHPRTEMRHTPLLLFISVLLMAAASSSLPMLLSRGDGSGGGGGGGGEKSGYGRRTWPCCDRCGGCTKSSPAQCQCQDLVRSCHPACRNCVRSPLSVSPPMYQCMDRVPGFCARRCSPEPLLGQRAAAS